MHRHETTKELSAADLHNDNDYPNDHEGRVSEYTFKNVDLIIDLPGADHIENLHKDKQVEHDCEVARWSCAFKHFVHWLLLLVLYHARQNIESSCIPFCFECIVVVRVSILQAFSNFFEGK